MLTLMNPERPRPTTSFRLPQDCISHILSYCDLPTTCDAYLVCSSWYHSVTRHVHLGDTLYYLPEHVGFVRSPIRRWFPSSEIASSSSLVQSDVQVAYIEVMNLQDLSAVSALCRTVPQVCLRISTKIRESDRDVVVAGLEALPNVVDIDLCGEAPSITYFKGCCGLRVLQCSFTRIYGIGDMPTTLEELDMSHAFVIGDIKALWACRGLRKLNLSGVLILPLEGGASGSFDKYKLRGVSGIEALPNLEELHLGYTRVASLSNCVALRKLNLSGTSHCGLKCLPSLEELELSSAYGTYEGLSPTLRKINLSKANRSALCIGEYKGLRKLDASYCYLLSQAGIREVAQLSFLEDLDLLGSEVESVSMLSTCRSLRRLNISYCRKLTDKGIRGLSTIPTLEDLNLSNTNISDISHLTECRALRRLSLSYCKNLNDAAIRGLETILTLETLDLKGSNISDVSHLSRSPRLRKLDLSFCDKLTDDGIRGIELIPRLSELRIHRTNITSLSLLGICPALRTLNASFCLHVTNGDGIRGLAMIPTLQQLDLNSTKIDDVSPLQGSRSLQYLNLFHCLGLTDDGIRGLESIPTLEELDLCRTKVRDVSTLRNCRGLRKLDVSLCDSLCKDGIATLEHAIPTLKVKTNM
eukprot:PhF_6_TR1577/c0_g1_i3/m.2869